MGIVAGAILSLLVAADNESIGFADMRVTSSPTNTQILSVKKIDRFTLHLALALFAARFAALRCAVRCAVYCVLTRVKTRHFKNRSLNIGATEQEMELETNLNEK
jgi:hypothetical protein